jgi:hypothetical protein
MLNRERPLPVIWLSDESSLETTVDRDKSFSAAEPEELKVNQ